ncbi:MAG: hypothetical protein IIB38_15560 [Candidatus Hydrogenedentes bacterium]|nr:hypothetical protein [Candidatus Hydrogenedentota bacterium]
MNSPRGRCTIELISAAELLEAARALKGNRVLGRFLPPPEMGVDEQVNLAVQAVMQAQGTCDDSYRTRSCIDAVGHARRALGCLVDRYWVGFGFPLWKSPPKRAKQKSELLLRRGVVDELTARVLQRVVDDRNKVEHEWRPLELGRTEDIVHMIRLTIGHIMQHADPSKAPVVYGGMGYSIRESSESLEVNFQGWTVGSPSLILGTFFKNPWVGIIEPVDPFEARVRRTMYRDIDTATLEEILAGLQSSFGADLGCLRDDIIKLLVQDAGLEEREG